MHIRAFLWSVVVGIGITALLLLGMLLFFSFLSWDNLFKLVKWDWSLARIAMIEFPIVIGLTYSCRISYLKAKKEWLND